MKNKVVLCLFLVFIMITGISFSAFAAEPETATFSAEEVSGSPGETVDVAVSIANNPGIIATKLSFEYDPAALELVSATDEGLLGTGTFLAGGNIALIPYSVLWEDGTAKADYTADGKILTLKFNILDTAEAGKYPIKVTYDEASTFNMNIVDVEFAVVNGAVTVTGSEPETYTVTYDYNYENAPAPEEVNDIAAGSTLTKPTDPTREGFEFGGWFKDDACTDDWVFAGEGADTVTADTTLFAKWTENTPDTYSVTYNYNYEGAPDPAVVNDIADGSTLTKPTDPTREGFEFGGWFKDDACTDDWVFAGEGADTVTADTTLFAKWTDNTPDTFSVTYNYNYEGAPEPTVVNDIASGSALTKPTDPTRDGGYTFNGWFKEAECTNAWIFEGAEANTVTESITLYAKWIKIIYTVTYNYNYEGAPAAAVVNDIVPGSTLTKPADPTREDFTFGGWFKDDACTDDWVFDGEGADKVTANTTLFAKWTENAPETYNVTYNYNYEGAPAAAVVNDIASGSTLTKPADPTREGFTFGGWFKDDACTDDWVFDGEGADKVTANTTLFAKWTENAPETYSVTYNYNYEGAPAAVVVNDIASGSTLTKPADPTRVGFIFGGWFKDAECTDDWVFAGEDADTVTEATTLYAAWTECQHADYTSNNNGTHTCNDCGDVLPCVDADNDGKCDVCGGEMSKCNDFEISEIADGQYVITIKGQAIGIENGVVFFTEIAEDADVTALGNGYLWNIARTENGWTIQNVNGQYLAADGTSVVLSDKAFDWKYNKGRFYTTVKTKVWFFETSKKYYLTFDGTMLDLSSRASRSTICLYSINASGAHEYTSVVTDPTCTEQGYTTYTCSKCGDSYQSDFVKELGHDYKEVVTDPTCTEQGYTTYTCSRCEDSYQDKYVDALGHVDDNNDGICDRCDKSMDGSEVIAFANVTKETKTHGWWIFKWTSTTYTVNIEVAADSTEVSEVAYSLNDGRSWKTGTQFSTQKDPGNFLIRVTDNNGNLTYWQYDSASGATVKIEG